MIGETFVHFEILEKLGEGAAGVVYKARDTQLGRLVALRILPTSVNQDPERKLRFVEEAKTASALNHPNLVTIYEISSSGGADYIATELVQGKNLLQLIGSKRLPFSESLRYGIQIADALAKAHGAGIVHHHLAPSNILVTDEGLVKVLDFGLARVTEKGMTAYMSPEQLEGKAAGASADVFAFGAIFYEMITGRRAFGGESGAFTTTAVLSQEPAPMSDIVPGLPADADKLVAQCLRKDPERRAADMVGVKLALEQLKGESVSMPAAPVAPAARTQNRWWLAAATAVVVLIAVYGLLRWLRARPALPKPVPITSFSGIKKHPALSPDGKQLAFSWDGEKEDNFDVYVMTVEGGTPVRLTSHPAEDLSPVWSPDSRFIAFFRTGSDPGIFVLPALGGAERRLELTDTSLQLIGPARPVIAWTPDGESLLLSGVEGFHVFSLQRRARRTMWSPPAKSGFVSQPAFSPDGRTLAFVQNRGVGADDLYRLDLSPRYSVEGAPQRLTSDNQVIDGLAWTADGEQIVFSSNRSGNPSLWRISASGGSPDPVDGAGQEAHWPSISRRGSSGERLAFTHSFTDLNVWRISTTGATPSPARFLDSTRHDLNPDYSPDGTRIAFVSGRSGSLEIWVCDYDGSHASQWTSLGGPRVSDPRWSPDGRRIAFAAGSEGTADIYFIDARGGAPRRLTSEPSLKTSPSWSRDGRLIYFTWRGGIWKTTVEGTGEALPVLQSGTDCRESADGRFLYYFKHGSGIWKMPAEGGEETRVVDAPGARGWALAIQGIYFADTRPRPAIKLFLFAANKAIDVAAVGKPLVQPDLAVSPDGRWLLYTQEDRTISDILMMEKFR